MLDLTLWSSKEIIDLFKGIDLVKSINKLQDHKLEVFFNDTHRVYVVSNSSSYAIIDDDKLLITYFYNHPSIILENENLPLYICQGGMGLILIFDEQPKNKVFSDLLRERTIGPISGLVMQEWNSKYGRSKNNKKGKD